MKTIPLLILTFTLPILCTHAQSAKYHQAMKENLEKFGRAKSVDSLQTVAAQFERIAQAEKTLWIPYYYASQVYIIQSLWQKGDGKDKTLDQAQAMLDEAFKNQCDSSECLVLQGFLYIGRLQVDPQARGAEYSTMANETFDKAIKANPENPRAYYMKGATVLNTPDFFGGGKEPAKPILSLAVEKFGLFKNDQAFFPKWGKEDCEKTLARCNQ